MELTKQHQCQTNSYRGQVELAVFDLVGQLLAISLEKYDVEIIVESSNFLCGQGSRFESDGPLKTSIDYEEVAETEDILEVTLSGTIGNNTNQQETFALFFSLSWDHSKDAYWKQNNGKGYGANALWLQFGKKVEQLSDPVFRVNLYRKESNGQLNDVGVGKGFLVFGREKSPKTN